MTLKLLASHIEAVKVHGFFLRKKDGWLRKCDDGTKNSSSEKTTIFTLLQRCLQRGDGVALAGTAVNSIKDCTVNVSAFIEEAVNDHLNVK